MAEWTVEEVAARFEEATDTARRLPRVRVQGYFSVWPAFVRESWERFGADDHDTGRSPHPPRPSSACWR